MKRTKAYYQKAEQLIPKAQNKRKWNLLEQLTLICITGQLKGFIPLPEQNTSEYLKTIQNKYGYLLNS